MPYREGGSGTAPTLIQSVRRAVRLLDELERRGGAGSAKQLAREALLPLPTAYHLLRTLVHEGLVRNDSGVYALVSPLRREAGTAAHSPALGIQAWVDSLSRDLDAAVYFVQYRDGEVEIGAVSDNPARPPVQEWADFRATAHAHAAGQSLLLQLEPEQRSEHLGRHPVTELTPHTVGARCAFERRLAALPRRLPVLEHQEYALGTACAAVPITVGAETAAVALSIPAAQGARLRGLADRLQERAEQVLISQTFAVAAHGHEP
ncbi:IclR family transcriptional regulator [Streptomyces omiyaensis]|uniref:IclR family transcriptional regulator n=1 Tax=Streptomyces omiyaensis TaxID=68247 RepID=A0ABW7C2B5_9ACTN|nr:IclR family transcriptional regulator C-terminal domain-containing protein [Streptomyces omiyaensis]GGY55414.1 transcriptional regulator [Streptomyces omiyaensis]